jgi:hypothetical protein
MAKAFNRAISLLGKEDRALVLWDAWFTTKYLRKDIRYNNTME